MIILSPICSLNLARTFFVKCMVSVSEFIQAVLLRQVSLSPQQQATLHYFF
jgi:hypothetical protein